MFSSGLRQETGSSSAPLGSGMSEITAALQFTSVDCVSAKQRSFWRKNQLLGPRVSPLTWKLWWSHGHAELLYLHIVSKIQLKRFWVDVVDLKGFSSSRHRGDHEDLDHPQPSLTDPKALFEFHKHSVELLPLHCGWRLISLSTTNQSSAG